MLELLPYVGCFVGGAVVWHFSGTQILVSVATLEARIKSLESSVTSLIPTAVQAPPAAAPPPAPPAAPHA